jgi:hypothetical protein
MARRGGMQGVCEGPTWDEGGRGKTRAAHKAIASVILTNYSPSSQSVVAVTQTRLRE